MPLVCEPLEAKRKPLDSYGAQFSLPYALACCFTRGRFGIEEIEEASYSDPSLRALAQKVSYEIDPDAGFPKYRSGEVIVTLKNGKQVSRRKRVLLIGVDGCRADALRAADGRCLPVSAAASPAALRPRCIG